MKHILSLVPIKVQYGGDMMMIVSLMFAMQERVAVMIGYWQLVATSKNCNAQRTPGPTQETLTVQLHAIWLSNRSICWTGNTTPSWHRQRGICESRS